MTVAIILFLLVLFFWHQTNHIQVNKISIPISKLPEFFEDFTIIHISDLHGKYYGRHQHNLIKLISRYHFDIIVFTGDMFRDNDEINSIPSLKFIVDYARSKQKSVYFVAGNHDLAGNYEYISRELKKIGVHVLDNTSVIIRRKDKCINMIGIKDVLFGHGNLDAAVKGVQKGIKILLAHTIFRRGDKTIFHKIREMKIDLVLTGHTHGFQINLFPLYITGEGLFPKYVKGLHRIENSHIYVNRGLGTSGINLRLFSRPELTFIKLKTAQRTNLQENCI